MLRSTDMTCSCARAAAACSVLLILTGCRTIKEKVYGSCPSNVDACVAACDDGIAGRGGCLDAGERYHAMLLSEAPGVTMAQALGFFDRACAGGVAEGCVKLFELRTPEPQRIGQIATTHWKDARAMVAEMHVDVSALEAREKPLRQGCDGGVPEACLLLGHTLVGKDDKGALAAYRRACQGSDAPDGCKNALPAAAEAEQHRAGCERGDPRACHCLGKLVWTGDPYRAIPIWERECRERYGKEEAHCLHDLLGQIVANSPPPGFSMWGQRIGAFDDRWDPCHPGIDQPVTEADTKALDGGAALVWGTPTVKNLPKDAVAELVRRREEQVRRCFAKGLAVNPYLEGRVSAKFQVDHHGYAVKGDHEASNLPDLRIVICVLDEMRKLRFPRPSKGLGEVSYPLHLENEANH